MSNIAPIAITAGEPAGIGPDLVVRLAQREAEHPWLAIADPDLMAQRASELGLNVNVEVVAANTPLKPKHQTVYVLENLRLRTPCVTGELNKHNSRYVLETLQTANDGCLSGHFSAIVTGPVHKGIINDAGITFSGHTEFFAEQSNTSRVVMMLTAKQLHVALATTHLALRDVPDAITPELLREVITILEYDLQQKFGIAKPRILICGLNPHAGEDGHLGREELDVIEPTLNALRQDQNGLSELIGPLPADTLFTPRQLQRGDAVLAMYHDQGLAPLKYHGFGEAVNVTLGLPYIRTSVDHGTALDLAGTDQVDMGSFNAAFSMAANLATTAHNNTVKTTS